MKILRNAFIVLITLLCSLDGVAQKTRIILDTDANNELDDQHAMAYMLFNGDTFDVEGITVNRTKNGGGIEEHFKEAERIVQLCNTNIKIYKGADESFAEIKDQINKTNFDGIEAVNFIIKRAKIKSDRKLVLVPVGKLTNIALALHKEPSIASNIRIVWLGSNYPEAGEYNLDNDISALQYLLNFDVDFEMVMVRYGKPSGTAAVLVSRKEIEENMPGLGPHVSQLVSGRHGHSFSNFGDYSVSLFKNAKMYGDNEERSLFDMAAIAILKNPSWAEAKVIPAPQYIDKVWMERPNNSRKVIIWENFDTEKIMDDFYNSMKNYKLAE
jgi:inosine-uridine nucleoside N-ribohydrolase